MIPFGARAFRVRSVEQRGGSEETDRLAFSMPCARALRSLFWREYAPDAQSWAWKRVYIARTPSAAAASRGSF